MCACTCLDVYMCMQAYLIQACLLYFNKITISTCTPSSSPIRLLTIESGFWTAKFPTVVGKILSDQGAFKTQNSLHQTAFSNAPESETIFPTTVGNFTVRNPNSNNKTTVDTL